MSNKTVKKGTPVSNTKNILKDHPTLQKIYNWAEKGKYPEAKRTSIINNIISSIIIEIVILYLSYKTSIFSTAGIIFAIINISFASIKIYKKENEKYHIAMVISQIIFIVIFIFSLLGIK